jgi:hypothetical protein
MFLLCFQLFVFSFLVILFLFMDVVAESGVNGGRPTWGHFFGTLLAIPVVLYGLSSLLTVAGFFVIETWNGFPFLYTVGNINEILIDWVTLVMMLGAPIFVMICTLFARLENWWEISFYTWFSSMSIFFVAFSFVVIYYETQAAWLIVKELDSTSRMENSADAESHAYGSALSGLHFFLKECVLRRQNSIWSGQQNKVRISSLDNNELEPSHFLFTRLYTALTLTKGCGRLFEKVDPPEKTHSLEEILGRRRFITKHNWSLERLLCSNRRDQSIAVIRGPAALKKSQIISSVVCVSVSAAGVILLVLGFMVWAGKSALGMVLFAIIIICCCFPRFRSTFRFLKAYQQVQGSDNCGVEDGVYQTFETYRVSRPSMVLRLFLFYTGVALCFLWPIATLIQIGTFRDGGRLFLTYDLTKYCFVTLCQAITICLACSF